MAKLNGAAAPAETETAASAALDGASKRITELVSRTASDQAAGAFGALQQNMRLSTSSGRTIEDVIEAMLAPMLKEWLEANLPRIVEEKVEEEVRRIARRH